MGRGHWSFERGEKPERPADPAVRRANLRRVGSLFRPYRARLSLVLAAIAAAALLGMAQPFLLRSVFDRALPHHERGLLAWLVGGMIAIAIVTGVLGVWQTWLSNLVGQRVM
ncbi:MAG TPA: hypothetical protein VGJ25_12505, partial [Gaiellaceae bacterium]